MTPKTTRNHQPPPPASGPALLTLADLDRGQRGVVAGIGGSDTTLKRRLVSFGVVLGTEITVDRTAPMGNPRTYSLLGYRLSLRNEDARAVLLQPA